MKTPRPLGRAREWYLSRYAMMPGWRTDVLDRMKVWRGHRTQLVKRGLLEQAGEGGEAMFRITDYGLAVLTAPKEPENG